MTSVRSNVFGSGVGGDAKANPAALRRGLIQTEQFAVKNFDPGLVWRGRLPGQAHGALFGLRIGDSLDLLDCRNRAVGGDPHFQRVAKGSGVIGDLGKLFGVHRRKVKVTLLPSAFSSVSALRQPCCIPVAELHPANVAAARFAVLGQMPFRPPTAPILEAHLAGVRRRLLKLNNHLVNLARIFPGRRSPWGAATRTARHQIRPPERLRLRVLPQGRCRTAAVTSAGFEEDTEGECVFS